MKFIKKGTKWHLGNENYNTRSFKIYQMGLTANYILQKKRLETLKMEGRKKKTYPKMVAQGEKENEHRTSVT